MQKFLGFKLTNGKVNISARREQSGYRLAVYINGKQIVNEETTICSWKEMLYTADHVMSYLSK